MSLSRLKMVSVVFAITIVAVFNFESFPVSALTYSQAVDVSFTFNPTISINLSSADLLIDELVPGSVKDSNVITVGVSTNNGFGYTLSANVGNDSTYDTRDLIRSDDDNKFTSIDVGSALDNLTTDNSWGFSSKLSGDSAEWASYSGLPLYSDTNNTATLIDTSSSAESSPVDFKIAAKASSDIPSGTYRNVINFIAVAKPEPTPAPIQCEENKICYSNNALDNVEGTMGKQSNATSGSTVTLLASNYSRQGFGFAGWNTAPDYSGTNYGPNEDVIMPADMSHGLPLYAMWVKSSGVMQGWNGCAGLNIGDVTALTDARDDQVYAVAKLADNNCWMIENLRLEAGATRGESNKDLSQGYGASTIYGDFSGLADAESGNFSSSAIANSIYYSGTQEGSASINIGTSEYPAYRMPRYNNLNTNNRAENPTSNSFSNDNSTGGMYSYGNYYTWSAAMANTVYYGDTSATDANGKTSETVNTSLCPRGWDLPYGRDVGNGVMDGGIANLDIQLGGTGSMTTTQTSPTGGEMSSRWRTYPNNFLYSGHLSGSSINNRGEFGFYLSSTVRDFADMFYFYLSRVRVFPGVAYDNKYKGYTVRCFVE